MHIYCFYTVFFEWKEKDSHGGGKKHHGVSTKSTPRSAVTFRMFLKRLQKGEEKPSFLSVWKFSKSREKRDNALNILMIIRNLTSEIQFFPDNPEYGYKNANLNRLILTVCQQLTFCYIKKSPAPGKVNLVFWSRG